MDHNRFPTTSEHQLHTLAVSLLAGESAKPQKISFNSWDHQPRGQTLQLTAEWPAVFLYHPIDPSRAEGIAVAGQEVAQSLIGVGLNNELLLASGEDACCWITDQLELAGGGFSCQPCASRCSRSARSKIGASAL